MTGAERTPPQAEVGPDAGIDDIQADIERTREQLGDTIEVLADKANVVGKARAKTRDAKAPLAIVAFVGGATVVSVLWRRRRRR